ncbi:NADH-ubiquinone oxidoreductase subunit E family protein [Campylobacter concisus]|uniref:NADH-ubiquinone oxidoreductase subunit E family protein n=1 Tax=Campylobacter concisus TaxID=199 RepID=UPI000D3031B0|nr:NADH-ubiquinone oxidoreductase subunit E family protein [Campylobacter concisus]
MRRVDLRHLKSEFLSTLGQQIKASEAGEVIIFLFEIGDFSGVAKAINLAYNLNCEVMNSLKFNQVDWVLTIKKGKI